MMDIWERLYEEAGRQYAPQLIEEINAPEIPEIVLYKHRRELST